MPLLCQGLSPCASLLHWHQCKLRAEQKAVGGRFQGQEGKLPSNCLLKGRDGMTECKVSDQKCQLFRGRMTQTSMCYLSKFRNPRNHSLGWGDAGQRGEVQVGSVCAGLEGRPTRWRMMKVKLSSGSRQRSDLGLVTCVNWQ